jgi:hypothetical protein
VVAGAKPPVYRMRPHLAVKATGDANAMPIVDSTSVWLNKRGSAMFLMTSKINKSIIYTEVRTRILLSTLRIPRGRIDGVES